MKFYSSFAVLAFFASSHAFTTTPNARRWSVVQTKMSMVESQVDISVPYDAPARLAYEEWCSKYDKAPDQNRYKNFKENYETIVVANVSAKKQARDLGETAPAELTLNEFADFTEEEYLQMTESSQSENTVSTGGLLGKAVEAAQVQSEASKALAEAADALAEEEELLAKQLGLESVEELELAIDSLDGIAEDGSELDPDNIAREARIRSAYLDWCKSFNKEPSEDRFPAFSNNFLVMEDFAKESGKEIKLNEYADCTEEEYQQIVTAAKKTASTVPAPAAAPAPAPAAKKTQATGDPDDAERRRLEAETTAKKQAELQARAAEEAKKKREEDRVLQKQMEEQRLKIKEWQSKSEEERRVANEQERAKRQKEQEARLAKAQADKEAEAIAAARSQAEKDASRSAQRRAFDEQAAEIARKQAREWDEKQRERAKGKAPVAPAPPQKTGLFSAFQNLKTQPQTKTPEVPKKVEFELSLPKIPALSKTEQSKPVAPEVPKKVEFELSLPKIPSLPKTEESKPVAPEVPKKVELELSLPKIPALPKTEESKPVVDMPALNNLIPKDILSTAAETKPEPVPVKKSIKKEIPKESKTLSVPFLSTPAPEKQAPKFSKPAPVAKTVSPQIDISDPVTEAFASFFGAKKEDKPKRVTPAPSSVPVKKPASPAFSLFSTPAPKPAAPAPAPAKKTPEPLFSFFSPQETKKAAPKSMPAPAPAKKPASPAFSFFAPAEPKTKSPAPAPKAAPVPVSTQAKSGFFSFGKPEQKQKQAPPPVPTPAAAKKPAFSFFGSQSSSASKPVTAASPKKSPPKLSNKPGTLSIFGSSPKPKPESKQKAPVSAASARPTISLFGGGNKQRSQSTKPPPGVPELSRWKQNANGSITGRIRGSKNFRDGEEITTSPVKKGATTGSVVKTSSGSQYFLK